MDFLVSTTRPLRHNFLLEEILARKKLFEHLFICSRLLLPASNIFCKDNNTIPDQTKNNLVEVKFVGQTANGATLVNFFLICLPPEFLPVSGKT